MTAIKRGLRFELCYAQLTSGGASERRNCIMNIQSIVRATGGRGLIVSSEAKRVLGVRAPADVSNLMVVWGLNAERAVEAATVNPRSVLVNEGIKRTSFRGVVNVLEGGERTAPAKQAENMEQGQKGAKQQGQQGKRKPVEADDDTPAPLSKRQQKKLRLEALKAGKDTTSASASASEGAASS
jgi:ribonuclease P/MRP protein subunit RPP1